MLPDFNDCDRYHNADRNGSRRGADKKCLFRGGLPVEQVRFHAVHAREIYSDPWHRPHEAGVQSLPQSEETSLA